MALWTRIIRWILAPLNFLMLLGSLALIGVAFWMRYDNSFDTDLKSIIYKYNDTKSLADEKFSVRVWLTVVFWSVVGLSLGAAITAIFGILSAVSTKKGWKIVYLVLFVILLVLEIGSGVALICNRPMLRDTVHGLIDSMYNSNDLSDLSIIQTKYHCCGSTGSVLNTQYCGGISNIALCDVAVFDSVDNTMMISGIIFLVVLIFQLIAIILPIPLLLKKSSITVVWDSEVARF